jgi:putative NIF3 family GTP cyclohydrolase 1 type 2
MPVVSDVDLDPIIFRGLKALTLEDTQQNSLLRLCAKGIGVYSPHTSVDGAVGGVNDWLAAIVAEGQEAEISPIVPCNSVEGKKNPLKVIN